MCVVRGKRELLLQGCQTDDVGGKRGTAREVWKLKHNYRFLFFGKVSAHWWIQSPVALMLPESVFSTPHAQTWLDHHRCLSHLVRLLLHSRAGDRTHSHVYFIMTTIVVTILSSGSSTWYDSSSRAKSRGGRDQALVTTKNTYNFFIFHIVPRKWIHPCLAVWGRLPKEAL